MKTNITRCPVCEDELLITRLQCPSCDTALEGRFTGGPFAHLSTDQLDFIELFVRCEGKLSRMEVEMKLSYPTIRNRLHEVIRALGYEPGRDEVVEVPDDKRRQILEDLDAGRINATEAMRVLQGEEE